MNISLENLHDLLSMAVDAGIQGYMRKIDPKSDNIKQSEAKRYLTRYGMRPYMLQKMVDAGVVTPVKVGDKQNSAVWYSLEEIKKAICTINLKKICNEDN